jgi:hypothetical protein
MDSLSGPELVKYIQTVNPGASIQEILEKTRDVSLQRIFVQIEKTKYSTPMDLLEDLCTFELSLEDTQTLMSMYGGSAKLLSESRSFQTIYEYTSSKHKKIPSCWCRRDQPRYAKSSKSTGQ